MKIVTSRLIHYKFEAGRTREKHHQRIRADYESGLRSGVIKTPTLFINGRRYDGPMDASAIVAASQPAMDSAPGTAASPGRFL